MHVMQSCLTYTLTPSRATHVAPLHPHAGLVVRVLHAAAVGVGRRVDVAAVVAVQLDAAVAEHLVVGEDDAPAVDSED